MPRAPESALRQVSPDEIKTREPAPVAYQLYEVQKSDTLAKIAKRYLGDEKRYREIQRLNQDQVPDVNRLKPGIRIRIPARNPDESA